MSVLEEIKSLDDLKKFNNEKCQSLCSDIREKIIKTINVNGGHLASNLGIVETTVALCKVFDFPKDKILFDVGHQCYPFKILTGRKDKFDCIRQKGGISGFPDREESEFDSFIAGHAGNSIGAGLGKCLARDTLNEDYFVIDVVGDGSFANGLNLEALTADKAKPKKYIVILNDNGMSISKNETGFYKFVSEKTIGQRYSRQKQTLKKIFGNSFIIGILTRVKNLFKRLLKFDNIFEGFGFKYVGVFDGNDINEMTKVLSKVKTYAENGAVLLHISTKKGKGYLEAENHADDYHGVGAHMSIKKTAFSKCLGETVNELIEKDKNVFAITAGMSSGTGLCAVQKQNPKNFIDVGIAEEYAVNLAAGMASEGLKPIVCIYSTFLQRAYDEIFHDVCIQNLPVIFCIDRAGLVGNDGKTHQGVFDISFLSHLPNLTILAPKSDLELKEMIKYALTKKGPVAIRYPNDNDVDFEFNGFDGGWENVSVGKDITVLAVGPRMNRLALEIKKECKKDISVINARIIKPLDEKTLNSINTDKIVTLEENSLIGGFGSLISDYFKKIKKPVKVFSYGVKDKFIAYASVKEQLEECELTKDKILKDLEDF